MGVGGGLEGSARPLGGWLISVLMDKDGDMSGGLWGHTHMCVLVLDCLRRERDTNGFH